MVQQQRIATEVNIHQLFNTKVYDRNGHQFAEIANVWVDRNEHPQFLGILTHGNENHIIPAQGAELSSRGDKVRLAYDEDTVNASPTCDPDEDLDDEDERRVYAFFQGKGPDVGYFSAPMGRSDYNQIQEEVIPLREGDVLAETGDVVADKHQMGSSEYTQTEEVIPPKNEAVVADKRAAEHADYSQIEEKTIPLREEELVVGKRAVEEGSVRLRKVVRSETVEQPVELRHEEIMVEREPGSGEKVSPESLGEEEYYIPLYHEEAVIQKQAREKERVHVGKRETSDREVVSEKLRREELKGPERQS
ncbi:MAG: YsnF/AvaK domain-containing protein [Candidatus Nitrosoglobus sp.]